LKRACNRKAGRMRKVFVVIDEDDDENLSVYRPKGVFSTKAKAEKFRKKFNFTEIEEFKVDYGYRLLLELKRKRIYLVEMDKNGKVIKCQAEEDPPLHWVYEAKNSNEYYFDYKEYLCKTVLARSREQAIKIVDNLRKKLIAENKWGK